MDSANKNYRALILWVVGLIVIGALIGNLTKNDINAWYVALNKSPLTPADYIFGIVWSILYAIIGISGWFIWQNKSKLVRSVKKLYIAQLFLNWSWTPLFFTYHLTGTAFFCILLLVLLVGIIIFKTYKMLRIVSLLLVPYLLWLLFAAYLNFYIWHYNA